jgi:hypothetical protein
VLAKLAKEALPHMPFSWFAGMATNGGITSGGSLRGQGF